MLRANPQTPEPGLAPAFQQLLEQLLPNLPGVPALTISPELNQAGVGRPDIALVRQGQPPRAFVELKTLAKFADPSRWSDAHDKRQYERLKELAAWSSSIFSDFHLFSRTTALGRAPRGDAELIAFCAASLALGSDLNAADMARMVPGLAADMVAARMCWPK